MSGHALEGVVPPWETGLRVMDTVQVSGTLHTTRNESVTGASGDLPSAVRLDRYLAPDRHVKNPCAACTPCRGRRRSVDIDVAPAYVTEFAMKSLLAIAAISLLCSCASAPQLHTSFAGAPYATGPTSANDPRLRDKRFYMDDGDDLPAWTRVAPLSNR